MKTIIYIVPDPEYGGVEVFVDKSEAKEQAELNGVEDITVYEVTESSASYVTSLVKDGDWEEIDEDEEE